MKFFYTKHALERLLWREVGKEMVEEVIKNPEIVDKGENSKLIASKVINREKIIVVYIQKGDAIIVITVMTR